VTRTEFYINDDGTPDFRIDTFEFTQTHSGQIYITQDGDPYDDPDSDNGWWPTQEANAMVHDLCNGQPIIFNPRYKAHAASGASAAVYGQATDLLVVGDFNGDGIPDSAHITPQGFTVNILGANGKVASTSSYAVDSVGVSIVAADFNQDGHLDIAVLSAPSTPGGSAVIFLGKGDGTFGPGASFPVGAYPLYLVAGDFNGDGKPDLAASVLAVQTNAPGTVAVLIGKGDGTFAAPVSYTVGQGPSTIVTADFTGDGIPDIVVLDAEKGIANKVWVLPGKGDGTFRAPIATPSQTTFGYLHYVDLNHDGKLDLLIADQNSSTAVAMFGNGDGTFQTPQRYASSAYSNSFGIVPLGDGNTAIFTVDNISTLMDVFFVASNGTVMSAPIQTVGQDLVAAAAGDVNGDHQADIALADAGTNTLYVLLNRGSGQFATPAAYPLPGTPGPLALADLSQDGYADAIVATGAGLAVLLGSSSGTMSAARTYASGSSFNSVTVADFNGDGKPDVAAAAGSGTVSVLPGNGDGTLGPPQQIAFSTGLTPQATASADVNGDGKLDLIVALSPSDPTQSGSIAVLLGKGDGTFQSPSYIPLPGPLVQQGLGAATVAPLAVGDVNGDSKPDIVTVVNGQVVTLLGNGNGTFGAPLITTTGAAPPQILIANLNGKPDLLLADCCGLSEASFLSGKGDGTFQPEVRFPSGSNPVGLAVADFNGDGTPDLAIAGQIMESNQGTWMVLYSPFQVIFAATAAATVISSANADAAAIAPGSLASAFGADLATSTPGSTSLPLPVTDQGTSVSILDAAGKTTAAPLVYVSPKQVNFYVPTGIATGSATVTVTSGDGTLSAATVQIAPVAPGVFELNTAALAAADVYLYSGGTATLENVYSVNSAGALVANPISLGSGTEQAYLVLYGTGFEAAGTAGVTVTVDGVAASVAYAGPQGTFTGLDQANVLLPASLAGKGNVTVQLTANGTAANPVNITIQ
jgi:uncharacterized protein (TIGR03437 family)